MRFYNYLKDQIFAIVLNLIFMIILVLFLLSAGNSVDTVFLILFVWAAVLVLYLLLGFYQRKKYVSRLEQLSESLKEKYLIAELMECPSRSDDAVFYKLLKQAGKSMMEQIAAAQREQKDYKEYIEQWIHEAKTPVTAIKLFCENQKTPEIKPLLAELEKLNQYLEQTLYYARSEHTEKDYLIRETVLSDVVHQAVAENKQQLMMNHVGIEVEDCDTTAYTDQKWIVFILTQLINNAIKYRGQNPVISFMITSHNDHVILAVHDNGIGISAADLPRIFDKGFTGSNGRINNHSTGLGLYLCRRLCDRLDIGLTVASDEGRGTTFELAFYKNHYIEVQG